MMDSCNKNKNVYMGKSIHNSGAILFGTTKSYFIYFTYSLYKISSSSESILINFQHNKII